MLQNYLVCGTNVSESIDFFGLNAYEWCGPSSYTISGYDQLTKNITGYPVPIFFSETGCNTVRPRNFADQSAIFGDQMDDYWSGAIIYEWIEEANNYGLIQYGDKTNSSESVPDGYPRSGTPTPISPDFSNLKSQWATLSPTGVKESTYSPTNTPPPCPSSTPGGWLVNGNVPLPTLGQTYTAGANPTGAPTGSAASATATKKGSASGGKEITGMTIGLVGVMFGFMWWL
jgi:1,3-beta-glucanosyltransferase GAS1